MNQKVRLFRESLGLVWKSAPGWATANTLISLVQSFLPLALIFLIKLLIDEITAAVTAGSGMSGIVWIIIAVVVIYFLDEVSTGAGNYVRRNQSVKLESYMYSLLHSKAVRLDLINFEHPGYYDCLARATSEAPWRPNSILNNMISMFRGSVSLLLMAGLLLSLHWGLVLLLLAVNVPGIWLRLHFADILYNFQRSQTPEARKSAYFNWLLTGERPSREIRLFGTGNYFISLFRNSFSKQKEEEIRIIRKRTLIESVSDTVKALALLFLLMFVAGRTIGGDLTLGQMAMFILAFRQGMSYIKDLFGSLAGLYEDSLFIGDTFEFLNLQEKITASEPVKKVSGLKANLEVKDLTFTYPGNTTPALKNISFQVRQGEIVALAGPNGAGKSTLVRLLTRLYDPDSGVIKYDGTDIRKIDPDAYRKQFSVVFQDFMLYNMGAGENIRIGDIEADDAERKIREAASVTGVHDLINNLPAGYDTVIGNLFDDSRELSWGEWQKLALSRALFRNAPVLILDEPSSALDSDTEYEIFSRLRQIVKGRTTILISHRLTNVALADRIIVVSNGEVAETGTHDELMKSGGVYHRMYIKQTGRFGG
ncbi:MAG: ABC transporter ATP-binding protein [Bacteroidales bacterium]|nr:ABC transporter ATP-binding protein [Bacteroidales bacterium]